MKNKNAAELSFSTQTKMIKETFGPYLKTLGWKVWGIIGVLFLLSFYEQLWTAVKGWLIDAAVSPEQAGTTWAVVIITLVAMCLLSLVVNTARNWCNRRVKVLMMGSISDFINKKVSEIQAASTELFAKFTNSTISKRVGELQKGNSLAGDLPRFLSYTIQGVIASVVISFISPWFMLLFVVDLVFNLVYVKYKTPIFQKWENRVSDWGEIKTQSLKDSLDRYREVHLNGSYKESMSALVGSTNHVMRSYQGAMMGKFKFTNVSRIENFLVKVAFYLLSFYLLYKGEMTAGTAYMAFTYWGDIGFMTDTLIYLTVDMVPEYANIAKRLKDVVDVSEKQYYGDKTPDLSKVAGIEVEGLTCSYVDPEDPKKGRSEVLKGVNLSMKTSYKYAIVGKSGCGKSTLVDNLCRLRTPDAGRIIIKMVDGEEIPIEEFSRETLPSLIGMVSQSSNHLTGSFKDQFKVVRNFSQERMEECCKIAQIHDFILSSKYGYNTQIGERGMRLSGGQRQRLSIALTLMQDPKILVMDEATSAQDAFTQKEIFSALATGMNFSEKIVILIAHRLSTVTNADKIFVLGDGGTILEEGTSKELYQKGGYYHQMVNDEVGDLKDLFK